MNKNLPSSNSPLTSLHAPWDHNKNAIWLASTVRMLRNIEKFKFPHKLELEKKNHILQLLSKSALQAPGLINPYMLQAGDMTPSEKEFLIEHFLLTEGLQEVGQGASFLLDATGETIVSFNVKDHIEIQCTDCTQDIEKAWAKASSIEAALSANSNYAFSEKFGFLTADPHLSGTSLIVSTYLHLPALIHLHTLSDHLEKEKFEGIQTLGLQGSPDDLVGDILMVQNGYTLGITEETILTTVRSAALRLIVAEKDARSEIKARQNPRFKDHISRAIGTLKHSYQLQASEALGQLSFLKLGVELGWIKGISLEEVNTLYFDSRRSHLTYLLHEESPSEEIAIKRAEYLRSKTQKITMSI